MGHPSDNFGAILAIADYLNRQIDPAASQSLTVRDALRAAIEAYPARRTIANAVQIFFDDGSTTRRVEVEYPIGHPRRRSEGEPLLISKFERNLRGRIPPKNSDRILELFANHAELMELPISRLFDLFVV